MCIFWRYAEICFHSCNLLSSKIVVHMMRKKKNRIRGILFDMHTWHWCGTCRGVSFTRNIMTKLNMVNSAQNKNTKQLFHFIHFSRLIIFSWIFFTLNDNWNGFVAQTIGRLKCIKNSNWLEFKSMFLKMNFLSCWMLLRPDDLPKKKKNKKTKYGNELSLYCNETPSQQ